MCDSEQCCIRDIEVSPVFTILVTSPHKDKENKCLRLGKRDLVSFCLSLLSPMLFTAYFVYMLIQQLHMNALYDSCERLMLIEESSIDQTYLTRIQEQSSEGPFSSSVTRKPLDPR